jgi:hypothetical protein
VSLKRRNKWLMGGAIALIAAAAAGGGIAFASSGSSPPYAHSGTVSPAAADSGSGYIQSSLVQHFAAQDGVGALKVLVSAGPGSAGSNSSAVIVGRNSAGQSCWTVVGAGGAVGGMFRCGTQVGDEPGEPADQAVLRVGCETSGSAGSTAAESASCIGFVGPTVAAVVATLADGSTQSMSVAGGAFAYAASTNDKLPTAFVASDASGQTVGRQAVSLANG